MSNFQAKRRTFIKSSLFLGSNIALAASKGLASAIRQEEVDVEIELTAKEVHLPLLDGKKTKALHYEGKLIKGSSQCLTQSKNSYIGPTLRLRRGQKIRIHFINKLAEKSIIHWHGLHLSMRNDSHPSYVIAQGETFVYEFKVENRAGTYWYHPHVHGRTASQIYHGLAGVLIIEDETETQVCSKENDQVFVLQDRRMDQDNQLEYLTHGRHDRMMGMIGDKIFINGQFRKQQNIARTQNRVRLVNASNAKIYKLAWGHEANLTIIGNDGGLIERPETRKYLYLAPGERVDLWIDLATTPLDTISLVNLPQNSREEAEEIISFKLTAANSDNFELPETLSHIEKLKIEDADNFDSPKNFKFTMARGQGWSIDGLNYEMLTARRKETIRLGAIEIWEFENQGFMRMPHPIHVHGSQFQIISRSKQADEGILDSGWKDTVMIRSGETVRVIKKFADHTGYFPFHCHNLEHAAMGMMRDFYVTRD